MLLTGGRIPVLLSEVKTMKAPDPAEAEQIIANGY